MLIKHLCKSEKGKKKNSLNRFLSILLRLLPKAIFQLKCFDQTVVNNSILYDKLLIIAYIL